MNAYTVYILYSQSIDRFYIGYTSNFNQRLNFHNSPLNKIWTKRGQPWEEFLTIDKLPKSHAIRIEKYLKSMKSKVYIKDLKHNKSLIEELKHRFDQSI